VSALASINNPFYMSSNITTTNAKAGTGVDASAEPATVNPDKDLLALFFHKYISNLYQLPIERIRGNNTTQNNSAKSVGVGVGAGDAPEGAAAAAANTKKNGMNTNGKNTRKNNNAKKLNNNTRKYDSLVSRYDEYMNVISTTIYKCYLSFEQLFEKLYRTTVNYRALVNANKATGQDFYYVDTHGKPNGQRKLIPENTVLIFLTPINRYGIICSVNENKSIKKTLKVQSNRLFIQNNLPCIDKFDKLPNNNNNNRRTLNTRYFDKYHKMFKNAIVLYPGQYYYDLDLSFTQKDRVMGISYFSGDDNSQELINKQYYEDDNLWIYGDTLSNLIAGINIGELPPEKYDRSVLANPNKSETKYFVIDCCRNYDAKGFLMSEIAKQNYIYENFMFYYNLIMANCKSTSISKPASYDLPDTRFASMFMYVKKLPEISFPKIPGLFKKYIEKKKIDIIENLNSFFGNIGLNFYNKLQHTDIYYSDDVYTYRFDIIGILESSGFLNLMEERSLIELILINEILQQYYNISKHAFHNITLNNSILYGILEDLRDNVIYYIKLITLINYEQIKEEMKKYFTDLNTLLQIYLTSSKFAPNVNVEIEFPELYTFLYNLKIDPQMYDTYYATEIVNKKNDFYNYLESLVQNFMDNLTPEQYFGKTFANTKRLANTRLGEEGRGYLIKTYNTMNTSLPEPVKKFIAEQSTRVITHLVSLNLL